MPVSGTGVSANNVITSIISSSSVAMLVAATISATTPLVFAPYGLGDGSTTFGLPNRARIGVGRDNASGSASNIMQASTTISTTSGSTVATVGSATGLFVGMFVNTPSVAVGTTIAAISGTTIVMSALAGGGASGAAARFSVTLDAQTLGAVGGAISQNNTLVTVNLPPYTIPVRRSMVQQRSGRTAVRKPRLL
jgi:microcystin-dependent protein